jgi:hypothetical protein
MTFCGKRIASEEIVHRILTEGNKHYDPFTGAFFLPLEFSVAAYRFGHSMVRAEYDHNINFGPKGLIADAALMRMFSFTAMSGQLTPGGGDGFDTLPENWIIEWERFIEGPDLSIWPRPNDTRLVEPLLSLPDTLGMPLPGEPRLAVRNLLRGYLLRMPTGQAIARAMGILPLTPDEILAEASKVPANGGRPSQEEVLKEGGFLSGRRSGITCLRKQVNVVRGGWARWGLLSYRKC